MNLLYNVPENEGKGIFYKKEYTDEKILKMAIEDTRRYGNCFFVASLRFVENKGAYLYSQDSYMWSYINQSDSGYIISKMIFNGEVASSRTYKCYDTSWIGNYSESLHSYLSLSVYSVPMYENYEIHFMQKKGGKVVDHLLIDFSGSILTPGKSEFMDKLTNDVVKNWLVPRFSIALPDSIVQKYRIEQCLVE